MRVQINTIYAGLFFCLFFYSVVLPQGKIKIVDANTLKPIEDVVVSTSSNITVSDSNGFFSLHKFNSNDILLFQHILYQKLAVPYKKLAADKVIKLLRRNISTGLIKVFVGDEDNNKTGVSETIKLDEHKTSQYSGVGELLKKNTTLFVKDYGGYSGLKTVSARGMGSENTLVLFNEARVNDLRTGTFNFAEIDSRFISKIIYSKNSTSDIQSSGGVVKLFSGNEKGENSFTLGTMRNSYKAENYYASLKASTNKISYSLNFNRIYSRNKYRYVFEGRKLQRENADFSKSFVSGDIQWKTQNLIIKLYTHYSHLLSGLPGFVVTNNFNYSKASSLTNSLLSIVNIDYSFGKNILFSSNIGYHKQYLKLIDPLNQLLIDRKSQSSVFNDLDITNNLKIKYKKSKMILSYNFDYGTVDSLTAVLQGESISNFSKRNEHLFSGYFSSSNKLPGLQEIVISSGITYQIINDEFISQKRKSYFSYRLGLEFVPNLWNNSKIIFSFADNYRHPSFNEAYYSGLFGNENLNGEKYKELNAGISFKSNWLGQEEFHLTYFSIWGNNKIIWIPTRLALQVPYNIKKIKSEGIELIIKQSIIKKIINAEFIYSFVDARNRSFPSSTDYSFNKQLIYTPKHRWNFNTYFNYKKLNAAVITSYVGESFFTNDNNPRNKLNPYFLIDVSAGYTIDIFGTKQILTLNAYNILDENYFVIQSYPMPLNSYSINYQVRF